MKRAVVISGARTPVGSFLGSLSSLTAVQLGSIAIKAAMDRANLDKDCPNEVIMGQVLQGGCGQAPARQAALGAGISSQVACTTVNKVCGSGLKAVMMAADSIAVGHSALAIAGGMESMSNAPYVLKNARSGFRMGNQIATDMMLSDGLWDPYGQEAMGSFGDLCAAEFGITRKMQDDYAHESYRRALEAERMGFFKKEITPVVINVKGEEKKIVVDEELSRYQPEKVSRLLPAFKKDGTVTVANASKISDGYAALVLASEEEALKRSFTIKARIIGYATVAQEPAWFTTAPNFSHKKSS